MSEAAEHDGPRPAVGQRGPGEVALRGAREADGAYLSAARAADRPDSAMNGVCAATPARETAGSER